MSESLTIHQTLLLHASLRMEHPHFVKLLLGRGPSRGDEIVGKQRVLCSILYQDRRFATIAQKRDIEALPLRLWLQLLGPVSEKWENERIDAVRRREVDPGPVTDRRLPTSASFKFGVVCRIR